MDISKAQKIEGWMSDPELEWLAKQAAEHDLIVEIGSYRGRSTRALGDNARGFVVTIDDFYGPRDEPVDEFTKKENYKAFITNMSDLLKKHKVQVVKIPYEKIDSIPFLRVLHPDFVFIDGSHEYLDVKRDINYWKPKMKSGGLLSGHDSSHPPVVQAVSELLGPMTLVPGTSIWITTV